MASGDEHRVGGREPGRQVFGRGQVDGAGCLEHLPFRRPDRGRQRLPAGENGLRQADRLPEPIFTPSTKAEVGHDQNITFDEVVRLAGGAVAERLRDVSLDLYTRAAALAEERGIIIADTKFEFGLDADGGVVWADEALTPDSSRFWPADSYGPGSNPPSFDKQFVRDWLESSGWDKQPPAPTLPSDVVAKTQALYLEGYRRLTGRELPL